MQNWKARHARTRRLTLLEGPGEPRCGCWTGTRARGIPSWIGEAAAARLGKRGSKPLKARAAGNAQKARARAAAKARPTAFRAGWPHAGARLESSQVRDTAEMCPEAHRLPAIANARSAEGSCLELRTIANAERGKWRTHPRQRRSVFAVEQSVH
eukprot:3871044-Amphidinium_carterae.1